MLARLDGLAGIAPALGVTVVAVMTIRFAGTPSAEGAD
jgi:hypothetical protein